MLVFGTFIPDSRFAGRSPLISLTNLLIARFGSPGRFGSSGRGSWNGSGQTAGQREQSKTCK